MARSGDVQQAWRRRAGQCHQRGGQVSCVGWTTDLIGDHVEVVALRRQPEDGLRKAPPAGTEQP